MRPTLGLPPTAPPRPRSKAGHLAGTSWTCWAALVGLLLCACAEAEAPADGPVGGGRTDGGAAGGDGATQRDGGDPARQDAGDPTRDLDPAQRDARGPDPRTDADPEQSDGAAADAGRAGFGDPCDERGDCVSGYCIDTDEGRVCTRACNDDCPEGWECVRVANEGGDMVFICQPEPDALCAACEVPEQCGGPSDLCLAVGDGTFCGRDCSERACPDGYRCADSTPDEGALPIPQCLPTDGWCGPCRDEDGDRHQGGGQCPDSLDCDDRDPDVYLGAPELCDGADNDCDGATDEGFDLDTDMEHCGACGRSCALPFADERCVQGECELLTCEAGHHDLNTDPEDGCEYPCLETADGLELCNEADDDCDGAVDEDFDLRRDPTHCGSCATSCPPAACGQEEEGYVAHAAALCDDAECQPRVSTECGAYTCAGGGEEGDVCARGCLDDRHCVAGAHCVDGECISDLADGQPCDEARQCSSGFCGNGFCCADVLGEGQTDCCGVAEDCPGGYATPPVCADAATCQGQRHDAACEESVCVVGGATDDDRGCRPELLSDPCGLNADVFCSGAAEQADPPCPARCADDEGCDPGAHCERGACLPDLGPGQGCGADNGCQAGLRCVDGVCCHTACEGLCQRCDLSGDGTCGPIGEGQDPDSECDELSCEGHFWGWDGAVCRRRADVPAESAGCNGAGRCETAAQLCGEQGRGPEAAACDLLCQQARAGSCAGTTAGRCDNLNLGQVTCGIGQCRRSADVCVNGAPNACVPGRSTAEVCDDLDNDCDNATDEGLNGDLYEPNAGCGSRRLAAQINGQPTSTLRGTVYPANDTDHFVFLAQEDDEGSCACCDLFCTDEDFRVTVTLTPPAGRRYELCLGGDCNGMGANCVAVTGPSSASRTYSYDGGCCPIWCSDSRDVQVRVQGVGGAYDCDEYTLRYRVDQGCY